ncbi:MAG TPA: glucosidase [Polyangia bacterium]|nr:glucosidase [Polyangia bacterium]
MKRASEGTKSDGDDLQTAEQERLRADASRERNWKRFGPYLAERQWGTVREDYSEGGTSWDYFPHDHARSRAYRWGEDGLFGFCDREGRLCFALALWNGADPILKERLFGLNGLEGNHGEDVKEEYFYLDATPTHSYGKGLYKYPQRAFPYDALVKENARRGRLDREYELVDTGAFADDRYFDVTVEHAKASPDDVLVAITIANRGPVAAPLVVLPTLWFRNTWSWGRVGEGYWKGAALEADGASAIVARHPTLGRYRLAVEPGPGGASPELLFTENETNAARLFNAPNATPFVKDAFHAAIVEGRADAVNPARRGTKAATVHRLTLAPGAEARLRLRLTAVEEVGAGDPFADFDATLALRRAEADAFYATRTPALAPPERAIVRQAYAGLLWTKQFYHYDVQSWLEGDPSCSPPPPARKTGRNSDWVHLYNRDVLSMPDKWEYPWFAAWDLAFHMLPFARIDPSFAKEQLVLLTREWYMHPNGQLPAYEWAFGDVNPPVHAWAAWRVYKIAVDEHGHRDRTFLARTFQKLLLNFTWWVNRKDADGKNLFSGGFLGLDNIGVFDRSKPLPTGGHLEQADGTAWMAFYCATMLSMALELARTDPAYEDMASKFFEHFVHIADAMNALGEAGLWDEQDGFYYDEIHLADDGVKREIPLRVRSMVGLLPLIAVEVLEQATIDRLPAFKKRMDWFLENRRDLKSGVAFGTEQHGQVLLALPSRERLVRVLKYMLDENELLSPFGIRSLSKVHATPYTLSLGGHEFSVDYEPGESHTWLFGGNSNWRGPVWMPVNYLLVEALQRYHHFYGDELRVECPTGSGKWMTLDEVARELARRLASLFQPDAKGARPCHGDDARYANDPHWRDLVLFHEYFHADTGRGVGATHQTGWTALVIRLIEDLARARSRERSKGNASGRKE